MEKAILALSWVVTGVCLWRFIPKDKVREAMLVFLFKQLITWSIGLLIVEYQLIEYPVRFIQHASQTSFTFEFFVYPAICAIFNICYPENKSRLGRLGWYVLFCTAMTGFEVVLEQYTALIEYKRWTWYMTWITLCITFYASRLYYLWFFKPYKKGGV